MTCVSDIIVFPLVENCISCFAYLTSTGTLITQNVKSYVNEDTLSSTACILTLISN